MDVAGKADWIAEAAVQGAASSPDGASRNCKRRRDGDNDQQLD